MLPPLHEPSPPVELITEGVVVCASAVPQSRIKKVRYVNLFFNSAYFFPVGVVMNRSLIITSVKLIVFFYHSIHLPTPSETNLPEAVVEGMPLIDIEVAPPIQQFKGKTESDP